MRTKTNDWYDSENDCVLYGIDALDSDGKWRHCSENGKPLLFDTPEERDAKRHQIDELQENAFHRITPKVV